MTFYLNQKHFDNFQTLPTFSNNAFTTTDPATDIMQLQAASLIMVYALVSSGVTMSPTIVLYDMHFNHLRRDSLFLDRRFSDDDCNGPIGKAEAFLICIYDLAYHDLDDDWSTY